MCLGNEILSLLEDVCVCVCKCLSMDFCLQATLLLMKMNFPLVQELSAHSLKVPKRARYILVACAGGPLPPIELCHESVTGEGSGWANVNLKHICNVFITKGDANDVMSQVWLSAFLRTCHSKKWSQIQQGSGLFVGCGAVGDALLDDWQAVRSQAHWEEGEGRGGDASDIIFIMTEFGVKHHVIADDETAAFRKIIKRTVCEIKPSTAIHGQIWGMFPKLSNMAIIYSNRLQENTFLNGKHNCRLLHC